MLKSRLRKGKISKRKLFLIICLCQHRAYPLIGFASFGISLPVPPPHSQFLAHYPNTSGRAQRGAEHCNKVVEVEANVVSSNTRRTMNCLIMTTDR